MIRSAALLLALLPQAGWAQTALSFPGNATLQSEDVVTLDSFDLPTGPWSDGVLPTVSVEGQVTQQVWRIAGAGLQTLQLLRSLREQLRNDGYDITLDCDTAGCGGFDFRFAISVMPPPLMQVDLADFRYLSAQKGEEAIGILVSRAGEAVFAQVTVVGTDKTPASADTAPLRGVIPHAVAGSLADGLLMQGHAVLEGVTFPSGATTPAAGPIPSLQALADLMADRPDLTVAIVGHTDASGGLDGNIAISRSRAARVVERLVTDYGVPRARLSAEGVGYLSPLTSNATPEGREANRRVEAVVTSTLP